MATYPGRCRDCQHSSNFGLEILTPRMRWGDNMSKTVVGVFKSRGQVEKAIEELHGYGIGKDEISVVSKDDRKEGQHGGREMESKAGDGGMMNVSGQDVSGGASWGGGIGATAGILAGAGALAIPGIGPILAVGPLAAALTGAVTGGIAGGLVDYGIPEGRGKEYEEKVKQGSVLTVVKCSEDKRKRVEDILRENGASDVESHEGKEH